MNDDLSKKKPDGNFPNEAAALADLTANAVEWATEAAKDTKREREAALARCLASKGVPTPEDVGRIRHLYIRLDRRVDGQRLLTGKRRETLRGLLVRWEELGAGSVDPILRSRGGGERDTWEDIWHWADKHRLAPREDEHAEDSDTPATPTAKPEERALAYLFENRWRQMTKQEIADAVDCHPKTLCPGRAPDFHAALKAYQDFRNPPRGTKSADGDVEAFSSNRFRGEKSDDIDE